MKKKSRRRYKKSAVNINVVPVGALLRLNEQINEWKRFADHLLITLGVGKEPMCLKFNDGTMKSVMHQLRRYYPQMGITEMIKDVAKENKNK